MNHDGFCDSKARQPSRGKRGVTSCLERSKMLGAALWFAANRARSRWMPPWDQGEIGELSGESVPLFEIRTRGAGSGRKGGTS